MLGVALSITFLAHIWSSWVWDLDFRRFEIQSRTKKSNPSLSETNIAKYLPGNIWHYYGRIEAIYQVGNSVDAASCSVFTRTNC